MPKFHETSTMVILLSFTIIALQLMLHFRAISVHIFLLLMICGMHKILMSGYLPRAQMRNACGIDQNKKSEEKNTNQTINVDRSSILLLNLAIANNADSHVNEIKKRIKYFATSWLARTSP